MRTLGAIVFASAILQAAPVRAAEVVVASPDGKVHFRLSQTPDGSLQYAVAFQEKAVIESSAIGIVVEGVNLAKGAELGKAEPYRVSETYPWYGPHSTAKDNCNGVKVAITHRASRTPYTLEIRAYDDGIAFRHFVPGSGARVPDEATAFRLPGGATLWYHDLEDHYEGLYVRKGLRAVPAGAWLAPPVTFQLPQGAGYASITEGGLRDYSGMGLQADGAGTLFARLGHAVPPSYPFRLRYAADVERLAKPAAISGPITTPWRIVMIGAGLNALANCDIVHNVAAPPDPKLFPDGIRTVWVKPGRSLWSYLDGGNNTLEGMKDWARQAAELGFEYNVLEGFWSKWPESQVKDLAAYSEERGVGLILWKHSNQLRTPESRREFFEMCRRTGVAGAKIDFFDHENKEVVDLYEAILRMAAQYQLVIDFHGCNKPTGLERTYPNLLGFEGIRGLETRPPWSLQDVTLPFTRMLAGLADYTPMHFGGTKLADTTWPHQISNAILFQAPLLVFAANPANILGNPAVDVIKSVPSVWDETVVLPVSQIGDIAAFARRKGDTWFLAVNNGPVGKTVHVDLTFLGEGSYNSTLLRDQPEAADIKVEHVSMRSSDALSIKLRSGGGFVGRFTKSGAAGQAQAPPRAAWMQDAQWGVMTHYLADWQARVHKLNMSVDEWNRLIDGFDVETLAKQLESVGARYYQITLGQNSGYYLAPNAAYDKLTGILPSKCSRRDLVADLHGALSKRGIRLMVYLPSGAPAGDKAAAAALEWRNGPYPNREFQAKWEQVIREWSSRWGKKVAGWWFDGCYFPNSMYRSSEPPNFASFAAAARAGNPDAVIAFNPGVVYRLLSITPFEDFTAGEIDKPELATIRRASNGWIDAAQIQMLSYLGQTWGMGAPRFNAEEVIAHTRKIREAGGAVTWDVPVELNGTISQPFLDQLKALGKALGTW